MSTITYNSITADREMQHVMVVGATGATGLSLVQQLLDQQFIVRVIVRSTEKLPKHDNLRV